MSRQLGLALLIASLFVSTGYAQLLTVSPYSRYGVGQLEDNGLVQNFSMGGLSMALRNDSLTPYFINIQNPASYTSNSITTFETGIMAHSMELSTNGQHHINNSGSFAYAAFAFPVTKWWGASFGLLPYSGVGYSMSQDANVDSVGQVTYKYQGSGGLNQFYIGNAFQPCKNLSLGFNASYLFGSIVHTGRVILPSSLYAFNTRTSTNTSIGDFYFNYGTQFGFDIGSVPQHNPALKQDTIQQKRHLFKNRYTYLKADSSQQSGKLYVARQMQEKVHVTFGFTLGLSTKLHATSDLLSVTYFNEPTYNYDIVKDTIQNTTTNGHVTLPLSLGAGMVIKKGERWLIGADYKMQNWSNFSFFGENQNLRNSMELSIGSQFIPNKRADAPGTYWQRVHYRLGARYNATYLDINNTPLDAYAVTFGLGLPVGRNILQARYSLINVGVELGQMGTTSNNLVQEQYVKAIIGFTLNDRWFIKQKFY